MIDVNPPSTLGGVLLALFAIFVIVSAIITTGILPIMVAAVIGGIVVYVVYLVLLAIHRWLMYNGGSA